MSFGQKCWYEVVEIQAKNAVMFNLATLIMPGHFELCFETIVMPPHCLIVYGFFAFSCCGRRTREGSIALCAIRQSWKR